MILDPPVVEATISPEDVKEGNSISLFCDLVDGNPQNLLRVRWFREDELLHETTEREIVWVGVTRNSSGIYSCEGENAAGWGERSEENELIVKCKFHLRNNFFNIFHKFFFVVVLLWM